MPIDNPKTKIDVKRSHLLDLHCAIIGSPALFSSLFLALYTSWNSIFSVCKIYAPMMNRNQWTRDGHVVSYTSSG